jgi:hypothetical protein
LIPPSARCRTCRHDYIQVSPTAAPDPAKPGAASGIEADVNQLINNALKQVPTGH